MLHYLCHMTKPFAPPGRKVPTRFEAAVFRGKTLLLQIRRAIGDLTDNRSARGKRTRDFVDKPAISQSKTPLWTETRLDWQMPLVSDFERPRNAKPQIVFPAATVGRKGCYELREALRGLDVKLILLGPIIEAADFWNGFDTAKGSDDWLSRADLVVLPAHVEHKPRRLLTAAVCGVPVIASRACGVEAVEGVETVEAGDAASLRAVLNRLISVPASVQTNEFGTNFRPVRATNAGVYLSKK